MSRHQEAQPILRDEEEDDLKHKKRFRIAAGLLVLFTLALIAGIVLMVINLGDLSDKKTERDNLQARLNELEQEDKNSKTEKVFELAGADLEDFSLVVNIDSAALRSDARIQKLNLTNNLLKAFHFNVIPTLTQLELAGNNITEFSNNELGGLKEFDIQPLKGLVTFSGNTMPQLTELQVPELNQLKTFTGNNLENVAKLKLPDQLVEFKDNRLSNLAVLDLLQLNELTTLQNNTIPKLPTLNIDNLKLNSFTSNVFEQLSELNIRGNNFDQISVANFSKLQTLTVNNSVKATLDLTISNTPQLNNVVLVMGDVVSAFVKGTALVSFPGAQSSLPKLVSLDLESNALMTKLDISKMPALKNIEIVDTPIESFDNSTLQELEFKNSNLVAFRNWRLPDLKSLELVNNTQMLNFSNNTCDGLKTLVIEGQNFSQSDNNSFDALEELRLTNTPYSSVSYTSNKSNMKRLTLSKNSLTDNLTLLSYPNLAELQLNQNDIKTLEIDSPALTNVQANIPNLQTLILHSNNLTDLKGFNNLGGLTTLSLSNGPLATFNLSLPLLTWLELHNLKITDIDFSKLQKLEKVVLDNLPIVDLALRNLFYLNSLQLNLPSLTDLAVTINQAPLTTFSGHDLPLLETLLIDSNNIPTLELKTYPVLNSISINMPGLTTLTIDNTLITRFGANTLPSLTTLSISNTKLVELSESTMNALTTLVLTDVDSPAIEFNFTKIPALATFNITRASLTSLSIVNATNLQALTITESALTHLDITNNNKLTDDSLKPGPVPELLLDTLTAFTDYTGQTNDFLRVLSISSSPVAQFQGNSFSGLTTLTLSNLPLTLLRLDAGYPSLTTANLNLSSLTNLTLQGVKVTSLASSNLPVVSTLSITNTPITNLPTTGFPEATDVSLQVVALNVVDFTLLPKVKNLVVKDSPLVTRLFFPLAPSSLVTLSIDNTEITSGLGGVDFPVLQSITISNSPGLDVMKNCNFTVLASVSLTNTGITEVWDNKLPNLATLTIKDPSSTFGTFEKLNATSLTTLYLENLGLSTFANNTISKLVDLSILGNNSITNLSFTNVNNTLQNLKIEHYESAAFTYVLTNLLTLELKNCDAVTSFANNNLPALTDLTLSGFPNLTTLGTNTLGKIQNIDISNTNLTKFGPFTYASLRTLRLRSHPALTNYSGTYANLTTLEISNTAITNFSGFTYNNLTTLKLSSNQINIFGLTAPLLTSLDLSSNQLAVATGLNFLNNSNIQTLNVDNNKLVSFSSFSLPALTSLSLSNNLLDQIDGWNLPALTSLNLANNKFNDENITAWLTLTSINPNILSIDLRGNPFADAQALHDQLIAIFTKATILVE